MRIFALDLAKNKSVYVDYLTRAIAFSILGVDGLTGEPF